MCVTSYAQIAQKVQSILYPVVADALQIFNAVVVRTSRAPNANCQSCWRVPREAVRVVLESRLP